MRCRGLFARIRLRLVFPPLRGFCACPVLAMHPCSPGFRTGSAYVLFALYPRPCIRRPSIRCLPFSVSPGPVFLSTGLCRRVCAAHVCMPQHKTSFLHVRKISTVNQIHQSVSPGFGPAPLLHPASALVRCFAHCFCPIAMHFHFRILYITNLFGKAMANDSPCGRHLSLFSALFAHSFKAFLAPFSFRSFLPQVPHRQLHTIRICPGRSVSPLQAAFQAKRFSLYSALHPRPQRQPRSLCRIIPSCRCQAALIFSLYCSGLSLFSPVPLADFLIQKRAQSALFDVLRINSYAFCSLASSLVVKTFLLL